MAHLQLGLVYLEDKSFGSDNDINIFGIIFCIFISPIQLMTRIYSCHVVIFRIRILTIKWTWQQIESKRVNETTAKSK